MILPGTRSVICKPPVSREVPEFYREVPCYRPLQNENDPVEAAYIRWICCNVLIVVAMSQAGIPYKELSRKSSSEVVSRPAPLFQFGTAWFPFSRWAVQLFYRAASFWKVMISGL